MTLGAKYTTYPAENFTAAAKRLHNNYSENPWETTDYGEQSWASGTLRGIIEDLGPSIGVVEAEERIDSLRQSNLSYGEAMARIWRTMFGNAQPKTSNHNDIADAIIESLESKLPQVEILDSMVEAFIATAMPPQFVVDRNAVRAGLAQALQTR